MERKNMSYTTENENQNNYELLFTQEELEADFEMVVDMMAFSLDNQDKKDFDFLKEFKNSKYESTKRLK